MTSTQVIAPSTPEFAAELSRQQRMLLVGERTRPRVLAKAASPSRTFSRAAPYGSCFRATPNPARQPRALPAKSNALPWRHLQRLHQQGPAITEFFNDFC